MALLPRLRRLVRRSKSASRVGKRRPTASRGTDVAQEDAVRALLNEDPNDERAFRSLAEIVRRRAASTVPDGDPLTAPNVEMEKQRAADLAVWSLAEELAGNPRAWYPLLELARLSIDDDHDGAMRRLATAAERDPTGRALADGLAVLRDKGKPVDALGLGVGHWRVKEHVPEVGRQLVHAAVEADRPLEAKHHLRSLGMHPDTHAVDQMRPELERLVAEAEQHIAGT